MKSPRLHILLILILLLSYQQAVGSTEIFNGVYQARIIEWEAELGMVEYVPGEIIIEYELPRFLATVTASNIDNLQMDDVFQYRSAALYSLKGDETVAEALTRLENEPGVASVSPNLIRHCSFQPNDPYYTHQQNLQPINAEAGWDVSIGSPTVSVAVIDTGMDVDHPELAGRVVWEENFFDPGDQGADNVFDDSGHGTGVAGIIAASGNNGTGIAGMAWDVRIMAFRACGGHDLQCTIADEVQAIDSAVAQGADVINLSLGGKGTNTLEINAIQNAYDAGIVVVAASGNGSPGQLFESSGVLEDDYDNLYYPAAFSQVIGVAALNNNGSITDPSLLTRAEFSNYGEDIVSVCAVGTMVQTTVPFRPKSEVPHAIYMSRDYSRLSGTSFACPQVSGLACLLVSTFPAATPIEIRNLIEASALSMGGPDTDLNNIDDFLGHGLIDAGKALGNAVVGDSIFENSDFIAYVVQSPVFINDVYITVKCKPGSDQAPHVSYFVQATAENAAVIMSPLPAYTDTYLGRFQTTGSGGVTIQVNGLLNTMPLKSLQFVYTMVD